MSIAGLKLTFPSRTRLIRGLATMVLHIRVWESSSMPGFFCPNYDVILMNTSFFFGLNVFRDDGTAHSSVGELRQGKRNLFSFLFCLFCQSIEKSSVNNRNYWLVVFLRSVRKSCAKIKKIFRLPACRCRDFFCLNFGQKNMWSFWITLHTAQQCFIFSARKMLHAPQVRFIKFSWSVIFSLNQDFFLPRSPPRRWYCTFECGRVTAGETQSFSVFVLSFPSDHRKILSQ